MLIRWATAADLPAWLQLADQVAVLFGSPNMAREESFLTYTQQKISKYEALIVVDRRSWRCLGIISFSRTNNRISWMAVSVKQMKMELGLGGGEIAP